jgi:uncharacterized protein (TIGR02246 family)
MKQLFAMLLFLLVSSSILQAQPATGIEDLPNRLQAASNRHDAHEFAMCFAVDADFTNVRGMPIHGRDSIEWFHSPLFAATPIPGVPSFSHAILHVTKTAVRPLGPRIAAIDIWWTQEGAIGPDKKPWAARQGLINAVVTEEDGQWLFKVFHNMDMGEWIPNR